MSQPVAPATQPETTNTIIWPGVTRFALGRLFGQWYDIGRGGYILTPGNLIALVTAPGAAKLYLLRVAPWFALRYRLTNRRIIVERGWAAAEEKSVELDRFDSIEVVRRPGMRWFDHGDLIFKLGPTETFRLEAVTRPHQFKSLCLKAHMAYTGVRRELKRQGVVV